MAEFNHLIQQIPKMPSPITIGDYSRQGPGPHALNAVCARRKANPFGEKKKHGSLAQEHSEQSQAIVHEMYLAPTQFGLIWLRVLTRLFLLLSDEDNLKPG